VALRGDDARYAGGDDGDGHPRKRFADAQFHAALPALRADLRRNRLGCVPEA
jgi:hypothetical protein